VKERSLFRGGAACLVATAVVNSATISAEEMLEKDSAKFLGFQLSTTDFMTCDNNLLSIPPGKVVKTVAKCQKLRFTKEDHKGLTITSIDQNSRTLRAKDSKGDSVSLFYPAAAENQSTLKLEWLKPGQLIDIDALDTKWNRESRVLRAESIKQATPSPVAPK
jgi:hypothetical protein